MVFQTISILAALLTTASFLPQTIKTIKTRDTSGISVGMYAMFTLGVLLWAAYGLHMKDIAIVLANVVTFVFAVIILKYKLDNIRSGRDK